MRMFLLRTFLRTLRFIRWMIIPGIIIVGGLSAADAQSQALQQACTPDAMRLCQQFIPDRAKITRCMIRKHSQISAPCRAAMRAEGRRRHKEARYRRRRVHYVHHVRRKDD
jgi:hypothetical protein